MCNEKLYLDGIYILGKGDIAYASELYETSKINARKSDETK